MTLPTYEELQHARKIVAAEECRVHGHDWNMIWSLRDVYPSALLCRRACGIPSARVVPNA